MKSKIVILSFVVFIVSIMLCHSSNAWSDFYRYHRRERIPEADYIDCSKLKNGIIVQAIKIETLFKAAKKDKGQQAAIGLILPNELEKLSNMQSAYQYTCRDT